MDDTHRKVLPDREAKRPKTLPCDEPTEQVDGQSTSSTPTLPVEILDKIIAHLKADNDLPALAVAARVDQCMYNLAIPRLYETVTMTEGNWQQVVYGHTDKQSSHTGAGLPGTPTRKDIAATFIRKLVLDGLPHDLDARQFRHMRLDEVTITARSFLSLEANDFRQRYFEILSQSLTTLAKRDEEATSLHVNLDVYDTDYTSLWGLICPDLLVEPMTIELFNVSKSGAYIWDPAYHVGALIHLQINSEPQVQGRLAGQLAMAISGVLLDDVENSPPGQIFLCDVSRLLLSPQEHLAAPNANEAARLRMFELCHSDLAARGKSDDVSKWDYFTSRVKFVDSGYKPSKQEMAAISLRKRFVRDIRASNEE